MQISESLRTRIVEDMLRGVGRNESRKILQRFRRGLSGDTISNVRAEFRNDAEQHGIDWAARKFNVGDLVSQLVEIGDLARTNNLDLIELVGGASVARKMKDAGVDSKELQSFITSVYQRARAKNYSIDMLINNSAEIESLEAKYGPFGALKKEWDKTGFDLNGKRDELKKAKEELVAAVEERNAMFSKNATDEKGLEVFASTRKFLLSIGLDMDDMERTRVLFENLNEQGFDVPKVASLLNSNARLQDENAKLEGQLTKGRTELEEIKKITGTKEDLLKEKEKVERALIDLRTQMKDAEIALARTKREKSDILARAAEIESAEASLKSHGAKNPVLAAKVLASIEEAGKNPGDVIELVDKFGGLKQAVQAVQREAKEKMTSLGNVKSSIIKEKKKLAEINDGISKKRREQREIDHGIKSSRTTLERLAAEERGVIERVAAAENVEASVTGIRKALKTKEEELEKAKSEHAKEREAMKARNRRFEGRLQERISKKGEELKKVREAGEAEKTAISSDIRDLNSKRDEAEKALLEISDAFGKYDDAFALFQLATESQDPGLLPARETLASMLSATRGLNGYLRSNRRKSWYSPGLARSARSLGKALEETVARLQQSGNAP